MATQSPTDRRSIRTRAAISAALIELIEEKGFEILTVSDITRRADINRSTFYLHFRDKSDLVLQMEAEITKNFEEILIKDLAINFRELEKMEAPLPMVVSMFNYFRENSRFIGAMLELRGDLSLQNQIIKVIQKNISLGFLLGIQSIRFEVPADYLFSYVISAHLGVIQAWIKKGCIETPEEMATNLMKLSLKGPFHAVEIEFDDRHSSSTS